MLIKLFAATMVFLDILKIPNAQEKVENWALSIFKRPIVEKSQIPNSKFQNLYDIDFDKIPSLPIKNPQTKEPYVNAQGAIVIDIATSKILYQKNPDKKFSIASLTKIMTALVSLENYKLTDVVTVPADAPYIKGAKINLREGEEITVRNLLYGLLLYSGNDAAYTLAFKMGIDEFVFKMNQKAKELGLSGLSYVDPTGLNPSNMATLKDLSFLAAFALRNPTFAQIVKTNEIEISSTDGKIKHPLKNTNRLLREYPGTFGVKTGYTEEAGHCLIAASEKGGHQILSVVLGAPSDQFKESMMLLDWAFKNYGW
jgi:D-alanyl-D-alanine carboxypeptidase